MQATSQESGLLGGSPARRNEEPRQQSTAFPILLMAESKLKGVALRIWPLN